MEDKIKKLKDQGKTIREIADTLAISKSKVGRVLGQDTDTVIEEPVFNSIGVKMLRKSDYTKEELKTFPTAPYWN